MDAHSRVRLPGTAPGNLTRVFLGEGAANLPGAFAGPYRRRVLRRARGQEGVCHPLRSTEPLGEPHQHRAARMHPDCVPDPALPPREPVPKIAGSVGERFQPHPQEARQVAPGAVPVEDAQPLVDLGVDRDPHRDGD